MSEQKIIVPNIGDFKEVEVIEVLVKEGQKIKKDDSVITLESDKSSVEVPSNFNGIIKKINIKVGDKISEGTTILLLDTEKEGNEKTQPVSENNDIKNKTF
jgi:pyruvate dehydrogenase E2 component (dihydrolipoamide acetyltransferase)